MTATTPADTPPKARPLPRPGERSRSQHTVSEFAAMREQFELALAAWERNRLNAYAPDAAKGEAVKAERDELDIALHVVTVPTPTLDCILGKLRVIMEYAHPGVGVRQSPMERLTLLGLHALHVDLMAVER